MATTPQTPGDPAPSPIDPMPPTPTDPVPPTPTDPVADPGAGGDPLIQGP